MQNRVLLLTGNPGVGKTIVLMRTVDLLEAEGLHVGGMVSREVRKENVRVGFEVIDLANKSHGCLASVNQRTGPQVGKYHVNLEDLNGIGVQAIIEAVEKSDIVAIDEIGPMELFSESFKQAVQEALESDKRVLAVVHWKANDPLINNAKSRADAETFIVSVENRDKLPKELAMKVLESHRRAR